MKKIIIIYLFVFLANSLFAQNKGMSIEHAEITSRHPLVFGFGPKAGLHYASVGGDNSSDREGILGYALGGTIEMQTNNWFSVTLDIMYSSEGYKIKGKKDKEMMSKLITPVTANFCVLPNFFVNVGVQPSILMTSTRLTEIKGEDTRTTTTDNWNRFDLGIPVGVSYLTPINMMIGVKYNFGLLNMSAIKEQTVRNSVFSLTACYKF